MALWKFYSKLDSGDYDIAFFSKKSVEELKELSDGCRALAFNTLGFIKSSVHFPLRPSPYLREADSGLYVRTLRVKMICNWCSSKALCDEWNKMSKGNYTWNGIQIVWEDPADYYVIINKPHQGATYEPSKTIIFHMEPWCGDAAQTWGVKTWGEWAKPDPQKFLMVRSHDRVYNTGFWQVSWTYHDFKTRTIEKTRGVTISSICSSKYFDPGHIKRIDFLTYMEQNGVDLHIYNSDNRHGFRSYQGRADPFVDKEKGIVPYRYYFMCENNAEHNFITEKLWEPILCETLCFYWGCPNVADHLDPLSYIQLDMNDFSGSLAIMKQAIQDNVWEQRLPILRKEKQRILEHFGFFPTLERILYGGERLPTNNVCFIHCCNLENRRGEEKLTQLLTSLISTEAIRLLDTVYVYVAGLPLSSDKWKKMDSRIQISHLPNSPNEFELPTLRMMYDYAVNHPSSSILYLHTKSISYEKSDPRYLPTMSWIEYMLYFMVEQASVRISNLQEYDVAGCDYHLQPLPHFSGNFWWARASYLATLDPAYLQSKMDAEMWLCTKNPKVFVCHESHVNLYHTVYPRSKYEIIYTSNKK